MPAYVVYERQIGANGKKYKRLGTFRGSNPEVIKNKVKRDQRKRGVSRGIDIYPATYLTEYTPGQMRRS